MVRRIVPVLLLASSLWTPVAIAQNASTEGLGFGIRPVGPEGSRGYFFFREVAPGTSLSAKIEISNVSRRDKTVVLRAQDTVTSGTGGLSYGPVKEGPGAWISQRTQRLNVPARRAVTAEISIRVPQDAQPGDHFGGVVAYDLRDLEKLNDAPESEQAVQLKFISRLAVPFRVRVPGKLVAEVRLRDAKLSITPSGSSVDVIFENSGNVLIPSSKGRVNVSQDGVGLASRKIALTGFTPGSTITVRVPFQGAPAEATYRAKGFLEPMFAPVVAFDETVEFGGDQSEELERETGVTAIGADDGGIPVWVWLAGAAALLLLGALLAKTLMGRSRVGPASATAPMPPALEATVVPQVPAGPSPATPGAAPPQVSQVDLNTASAEDLVRLPGIGPVAAQRIIEHRLEFGHFVSLDDLRKVKGFGAERVAALAEHVSVSAS